MNRQLRRPPTPELRRSLNQASPRDGTRFVAMYPGVSPGCGMKIGEGECHSADLCKMKIHWLQLALVIWITILSGVDAQEADTLEELSIVANREEGPMRRAGAISLLSLLLQNPEVSEQIRSRARTTVLQVMKEFNEVYSSIVLRMAISYLDRNGKEEDLSALVPFLDHADDRFRVSAEQAFNRIVEREHPTSARARNWIRTRKGVNIVCFELPTDATKPKSGEARPVDAPLVTYSLRNVSVLDAVLQTATLSKLEVTNPQRWTLCPSTR
jgi:hypothetical protein